jgi:hypothetical protein
MNQDHKPRRLPITLLSSRRPELGLGVAESGDRFDRDGRFAVVEQRIERAQVAGNRDWSFELPRPSVADPRAEAAEECDLGGVAEAASLGVETGVQAKPDSGAMACEVCDRQVPQLATFHTGDASMGGAHDARNVQLSEAPGQPRLSEFRAEVGLQTASRQGGLINWLKSVRHRPIMGRESLPVP